VLVFFHLLLLAAMRSDQFGGAMVRQFAVLLAMVACCAACHPQTGSAQTPVESSSHPCSDVTMFGSAPLSALPQPIEKAIRTALKPSILAVAKITGADMDADFQPETIKVDALLVAKTGGSRGLYVIHWGSALFGVNGFVWIVEVNARGARNLVDPQWDKEHGFGGFGMEVISRKNKRYPELMFAGKGYAEGGGGEAEAGCARKVGSFYEYAPCPVDCYRNLNAR
jgi:hypothetical protein